MLRLRLPMRTLGHRVMILNLLEAVFVHKDNVTLEMRGARFANFFTNNPVLAVRQPSSAFLAIVVVVESEDPMSGLVLAFRLGFCKFTELAVT